MRCTAPAPPPTPPQCKPFSKCLMSFNFIIFPDCMEPASGPGAGSRLPAPLRGAEGLVSPRASGLSPCPAPEGTAGARGSQARLCGMSPGTRRESGSVPRPEVTGIVWPGCPRSSSGSSGPALAGNGAKPGGATPAGGPGAGAVHPLPQGIPQGAARGRGISSPTLSSISLGSAMASGWQLQNSLHREKTAQEAAPASQDPISPSRDHRLERGADSALLASKQGLEPRSEPGELYDPSLCSVEPLKKLQDA